jgi:hypothetical protein
MWSRLNNLLQACRLPKELGLKLVIDGVVGGSGAGEE